MNRRLSTKIYVAIALNICILIGLAWLIFRPDHKSQAVAVQNTPSPSAISTVIPETTSIPSAEPSVTAAPEKQSDFVSDDSLMRIVNRKNPVSSSYVPADMVTFNGSSNGSQLLRKEASDSLQKMFDAASGDGIHLYLISGYRSYEQQVSLYNTYVNLYGAEYADSIDDRPGECEHQLGLMADIGTEDHGCDFDECFGTTDAYSWLEEHAAEYGWIERYPAGKEEITGIAASAWNWRYVGIDEAVKIRNSGLTLEEYEQENAY